ncbi:MAG: hypothetical protein ACLTLQ_08040 [[Clostridium] scindens]
MRRIKSALLVTVLTCGLVVTPVFAEPSVDDLKKDKEAAQSEVDSLQSELTDLLSKIQPGFEETCISKVGRLQAEEDLARLRKKKKKSSMKPRREHRMQSSCMKKAIPVLLRHWYLQGISPTW